jgi:hypothetical protein
MWFPRPLAFVFCTFAPFIDVPAWILDTLRSFLAHEVENDEFHGTLLQTTTLGTGNNAKMQPSFSTS